MKPAKDIHFPVHELIRQRWSPRAFAGQAVEPEKLSSVFEAARWAASSYNEQPWRFVVAERDNGAAFPTMLACMKTQNQQWAQGAPVVLLAVARLHFSHNGKANRHAFHDTGLALANMSLQATHLGLHMRQIAGFDPEKAQQAFGIPADFAAVTMAALGYLGDADVLPAHFRMKEHAPQVRRSLHETVFREGWQNS